MNGKVESPVKRPRHVKKPRYSSEFDSLEFINAQLKSKLKMLSMEMQDGVERMNSMTIEMNMIKNENFSLKERLVNLENEHAIAISQVEEMTSERMERDAVIEEFGSAVEARIIEWKEILDEKDRMIIKLKENLMSVSSDQNLNVTLDENRKISYDQFIKDIERRDEIIGELQSKLAEAVVEINESSLVIEKFKSDTKSETSKKSSRYEREMQRKMSEANKKIETLQNLLEQAEKDAKIKSEQLNEALTILYKYEDKETSLTESLHEIKELKDTVTKKNQHIEDLVDVVNRLEDENSKFEREITVLRDKFDCSDEDSSIKDLLSKRQKLHEEKLVDLRRANDQLESANVSLKFQIRKLKNALKQAMKNKLSKINGMVSEGENDRQEDLSYRSESKKEHMELKRIKENIECIVEENEALRQGMHEILDSIHKQDGSGVIKIQSETLENLLQALDARHLAGWYHPAMRLQGRVNYLQGSNAELRAQLQQIRQNQLIQQEESFEEGECLEIPASPLVLTPSNSPNSEDGQKSDSSKSSTSVRTKIENVIDERKSETLESNLKSSESSYKSAKKRIKEDSELRKVLNISEKHRKFLENQIQLLQQKYVSYVTAEDYKELKNKYLRTKILLRSDFENQGVKNGVDVESELRKQLADLHIKLNILMNSEEKERTFTDKKEVENLNTKILELTAENEALKRSLEISNSEISAHRTFDSSILKEFAYLREKFLSNNGEDTADGKIAKLSSDLVNYKIQESDLREKKKMLESELERSREELLEIRKQLMTAQILIVDNDMGSDSQLRQYIDIINYLQSQYAGSTSLSAWERYENHLNKLNEDQSVLDDKVKEVNKRNEELAVQQESLKTRLESIEKLKDELGQSVGKDDVERLMEQFTLISQQSVAESEYKVKIEKLEQELQSAKQKLSESQLEIEKMELEMVNVQKVWKVHGNYSSNKSTTNHDTQTDVAVTRTSKTQCKLCCNIVNTPKRLITDESENESTSQESMSECEMIARVDLLHDQLKQALTLASERSVALTKCESQLAEHRARTATLSKLLEEKNSLLLESEESSSKFSLPHKDVNDLESSRIDPTASNEALQTTVKTLQKIILQKEETIERYQMMLKEDRDKHSQAAVSLQDEIKGLRKELATTSWSVTLPTSGNFEESLEFPERENATKQTEVLKDRITRLETELSLGTELADKWHKLADERLRHMENMRERLEEQHKSEIERYRSELTAKERDFEQLRHQIAENRKSEVHLFMRELQIKDNKLADEIENDLEEHATSGRQLSTTYDVIRNEANKEKDVDNPQAQIESLRKQLQVLLEREKVFKSEISDLKQQLSRKYMAEKAQEKKTTKREVQLDRKIKELEEELRENKEILDRHFMVQQAKRAKTAEDLGLWEKLKKCQQKAEKLKEKLKLKSDECERLQNNEDKLRSLISCMEREKWHLRSKCKLDNTAPPSAHNWPGDALHHGHDSLVDELKRECQELRDRVKELVCRLSIKENEEELRRIEERDQQMRLSEFEKQEELALLEDRMKKLEATREVLEKANLKLESENFELRLEVEKAQVNMPRLQEKLSHLEKYVELLKSEKTPRSTTSKKSTKSKVELEKTVVTLRKVVEKLQKDNKLLRNANDQNLLSARCECGYLRDQLSLSRQRLALLESELELAEKKILILETEGKRSTDHEAQEEIRLLKVQLQRKTELLFKIRGLLAEAAVNEKSLRQRIQQLEFRQTLDIIPEYAGSPYMPT